MSLSCYLIDDEYHALDILEDHIRRTPGLTLAGRTTDPLQGLEALSSGKAPDLTFIDIDMPELSGLDLAGLVNRSTTVIFTTSYREYAVEAFEKEAADYLLKPIFYERFLKCIQRVRLGLQKQNVPALSPTLFVKTGVKGRLRGIPIEDIRYAAAALNYIEIFLPEERVLTYLTLGELMAQLPEDRFSRIHRSYLVNHRFIGTLEYSRLTLNDQTVLPVGRLYRAGFRLKMNDLVLLSKRDQPG